MTMSISGQNRARHKIRWTAQGASFAGGLPCNRRMLDRSAMYPRTSAPRASGAPAVVAPSMVNAVPEMKDASSLARKATDAATSSGVANRPSGED